MRTQSKWFYLERPYQINEYLELPQSLSNRIAQVLRMKVGQEIVLFNGLGQVATAHLDNIKRHQVGVEISAIETKSKPSGQISLALPVCANSTMTLLFQKATELGCNHFLPTLYAYSKSTGKHKNLKTNSLERWQTIITQACEQSERPFLPTIAPPQTFDDLLQDNTFDAMIQLGFDHEVSVNDLPSFSHKHICLCLGPEGGMTHDESTLLKLSGAQSLCLGSGILRVETALIVALGIIQWHRSDHMLKK